MFSHPPTAETLKQRHLLSVLDTVAAHLGSIYVLAQIE